MKNELKKLARQQPNKKFLGFWRLRLSVYNMASRDRKAKKSASVSTSDVAIRADTTGSRFNLWLRDKIGEEPVLFDSTMMKSSQVRMRQHLFNNGYFKSDVASDYDLNSKKKKTQVHYYIDPRELYHIDSISFTAEDSVIDDILQNNLEETLVFSGDPFIAKTLDAERVRLTNLIQNEGYFTFNRGYIIIEVDTVNQPGTLADVSFIIKNPQNNETHKKYYIGNVTFELKVPERRLKKVDLTKIDTALIRNVTTYLPAGILKPKPIVRSIFFSEDSLYRKSDYSATLRRLNSLNVFRSVNIKFEPYQISPNEGILDTRISGTMRKKQTVSIDNEWNTDSESSLGIELSNSYINRNIFRSANRIEFNLAAGMELQLKRNDESEVPSRVNTVELRTNIKIKFPELTIPYKRKKAALPVINNQESAINLNYEFERRLGFYTINTANISWQHDWYSSKKIKHILKLPSLEMVAPREKSFSAAFLETLEEFPSLKRSFEPQLIASLIDYSLVYTDNFQRDRHSVYFRGNGKIAGNIIHGIASASSESSERPLQIMGIDYSQFVRLESDFRYYLHLRNDNTLATRFVAGIGIPYGNVEALPFTEQFYAGGNQSLRGWNYRALGPGGFDTRSLTGLADQAGDILLEFNAEFRFTIYKFVKAALFVDAGNIWLLRKDEDREDAEFRFTRSDGKNNNFIDELAINLGVGVRLDFNFFVVRLDAGLPIRDPAFDDKDRWQFDKIDLSKGSDYRERIGLRIGIGYPF